jgi:hypothetical protein
MSGMGEVMREELDVFDLKNIEGGGGGQLQEIEEEEANDGTEVG